MSNPKITSLAARLVEPNNHPHRKSRHDDDEDLDDDEALFAELEEEIENDSNSTMREQGLQMLRREMERMQEMKQSQHGTYNEITDEKEVVRITAHEPQCVVHFYHPNFKRCEIMDKHLAKIAPKYFNTRFFRVFVENIPWLVEKLAIKVLPCVICFVKGVTKDRLVGFEELRNNDAFTTAALELRLSVCGVIQKPSGNVMDSIYTVSSQGHNEDDNGDVFDLDDYTMTLSVFQSTPSHPSPFNGLGLFVPAATDPRETHDIYGQLWEVLRPLWTSSDNGVEGKECSSEGQRKSSLASLKSFLSF
ncbi:thioredoxin-like protein [Rhodocollybia butyracea]|uniref:Thioredoxin-like protein n=1 Tax=Rhodocollybia butyracea TaxID=206335 RepID=A0A9P5Q8U2_9AGAR|nr:thioredoxin-like protein [Rhodocollybia butyracea]